MGDTLKTAWAGSYWVKGWKEEKETKERRRGPGRSGGFLWIGTSGKQVTVSPLI